MFLCHPLVGLEEEAKQRREMLVEDSQVVEDFLAEDEQGQLDPSLCVRECCQLVLFCLVQGISSWPMHVYRLWVMHIDFIRVVFGPRTAGQNFTV